MVKECMEQNQSKQGKAPPVITMPFERIAIDVVGPLPNTARKNRYILTIMDMATREAVALCRVDTEAALEVLINFFSRGFVYQRNSFQTEERTSPPLMKEIAT